MVSSGSMKKNSLYLRLQGSSKCCVTMDIKRSDQEDRLKPESSKCSMHRRGSCPETASLK